MPCHHDPLCLPGTLRFDVVIPMLTPVAVEDYLLDKGTGAYKREGFVDPATGRPMILLRFEDETTARRFEIATGP